MWFFFDYVLIASQVAEAKQTGSPRGNLSDLYPRWLGARELLLHGRDPYSQIITDEIQQGYYGRKIDRSNPNDPKDEARFAYPVYVAFVLAPTVKLPFGIVQRGFYVLLVLLTGASVWWWMRLLGLRLNTVQWATAIVLVFGSYPVVQGLHLQQLSLFVAALIAAACAAVASGFFGIAGFLLALAMIKPQLTVPVAAWLSFWALWKWRERKWLAIVFVSVMLFFLAGSELLLTGWIAKWREASRAYMQYAGDTKPLLFTLFGSTVGSIITALIVGAIVWMAIRYRAASADSVAFRSVLVAVVTATVALTPVWHPYDQVLLIPAIVYCSRFKLPLNATPPVRVFSNSAMALVCFTWTISILVCAVWAATNDSTPAWLQQSLGFAIVLLPLGSLLSVAVVSYERLNSSRSVIAESAT